MKRTPRRLVRPRSLTALFTVTALLAALVAPGCTTVIHRRDAPPIEGRIDRSDVDTVYVELDDGQIVAVSRDAIEEVDHAGTTTAIVSGTIGGLALVGLATSLGYMAYDEVEQDRCYARNDPDEDCESWVPLAMFLIGVVPSVVVLVPSAGTFIGAMVVRGDSIEAIEAGPRHGDVTLTVAPWVAPESDGQARGGLGVGVTF